MGYPAGTGPEFHVVYADEHVYVIPNEGRRKLTCQRLSAGPARLSYHVRPMARRPDIHT
jgi:hypothetical protein